MILDSAREYSTLGCDNRACINTSACKHKPRSLLGQRGTGDDPAAAPTFSHFTLRIRKSKVDYSCRFTYSAIKDRKTLRYTLPDGNSHAQVQTSYFHLDPGVFAVKTLAGHFHWQPQQEPAKIQWRLGHLFPARPRCSTCGASN